MARKLPNREALHLAAEDRLPFDMPEVYSVEKALNNIELHLLPANLVAPALIVAATFLRFRIKLDMVFDTHRQLDGPHFTDFFETMENMQKSMFLTVADLEKQVAALG